jgi:D-serine deaminase-like pyridoxal phosphate-dependent protein
VSPAQGRRHGEPAIAASVIAATGSPHLRAPPFAPNAYSSEAGVDLRLSELETPALVLERRILLANLARMQARADALGVRLRPHLKTVKCAEITQLVLEDAKSGVTVSTLQEADYFAEQGIRDILYAVAISPNKLSHAAKLIRLGVKLTLILDTVAAVHALIEAARIEGVHFDVLIEIDCDGHRSGIAADAPQLLDIASRLASSPSTCLRGVLTHAGEAYSCNSLDEIVILAERERAAAVSAMQTLRHLGFACTVVSVGSTPTVLCARDLRGVTEVRAGVYMLNDLVMSHLGVCSTGDIAISVLCSVIGYQRRSGNLIVDAGWTALTRDPGVPQHAGRYGYGFVCDRRGRPIDGLVVTDMNQEHGLVGRLDGLKIDLSGFEIGSQLRILPVHACATAGQYGEYVVVEGTCHVLATWARLTGH